MHWTVGVAWLASQLGEELAGWGTEAELEVCWSICGCVVRVALRLSHKAVILPSEYRTSDWVNHGVIQQK